MCVNLKTWTCRWDQPPSIHTPEMHMKQESSVGEMLVHEYSCRFSHLTSSPVLLLTLILQTARNQADSSTAACVQLSTHPRCEYSRDVLPDHGDGEVAHQPHCYLFLLYHALSLHDPTDQFNPHGMAGNPPLHYRSEEYLPQGSQEDVRQSEHHQDHGLCFDW